VKGLFRIRTPRFKP